MKCVATHRQAYPDRYFTPQYGQLVDLIRSRALRTVTLNDVFA